MNYLEKARSALSDASNAITEAQTDCDLRDGGYRYGALESIEKYIDLATGVLDNMLSSDRQRLEKG